MAIFDKEHNKKVLADLKQQGYELTEEQLIAVRKVAFATVQQELRKRGHEPPESDEELFLLLQTAVPTPQSLCQFCGSEIPPKCTTCFQCGCEEQQ